MISITGVTVTEPTFHPFTLAPSLLVQDTRVNFDSGHDNGNGTERIAGMVRSESLQGRRQFLKMLAASPLLRLAGLPPLLGGPGASVLRALDEDNGIIDSLDEALEVMDFRAGSPRR